MLSSCGYLPSPDSLAHRLRLFESLRPLKRNRARVPFYELPAHRIPVLWTLYRGLLRAAPSRTIRDRVTTLFRRNRHLTSLRTTKMALLQGHKWLHLFKQANQGNTRLQQILTRYDRMIMAKMTMDRWKEILLKEDAWQKRLRNRPILTGAHHRPTFFNRPLPRLKPQPESLSMMIHKRRVGRERRLEKWMQNEAWRDDMLREMEFEERILAEKSQNRNDKAVFQRNFSGGLEQAWDEQLRAMKVSLLATFITDRERLQTPFSAELSEIIARARRARFVNKQREHEREKKGEILRATIRRRNKGPPAHILQKMTPEERQMDKVVRSVSEVGYVGMMKRRLGWKLKDSETWKVENGRRENKARLDKMDEEIMEENLRRRRAREERERVGTDAAKPMYSTNGSSRS